MTAGSSGMLVSSASSRQMGNFTGGMAVPTVATDGQHVVPVGTGDLVVDFEGKPLSSRSLAQEYCTFRNRWGMAASPCCLMTR